MSLATRLRYALTGAPPQVRVALPERYRGAFLVSLHDGTPHDPDTEVAGIGRRVVTFKVPTSPAATLTTTEAVFVIRGEARFDHWALWPIRHDRHPLHTGRLPRAETFGKIGGDYTMVVSLNPPAGLEWPSEVRW